MRSGEKQKPLYLPSLMNAKSIIFCQEVKTVFLMVV